MDSSREEPSSPKQSSIDEKTPDQNEDLKILRDQARKYTELLESRITELEAKLHDKKQSQLREFRNTSNDDNVEIAKNPSSEDNSGTSTGATAADDKSDEKDTKIPSPRYKVFRVTWNSKTGEEDEILESGDATEVSKKDETEQDQLSFTYRKYTSQIGTEDVGDPPVVEIHSRLYSLLRKLIRNDPLHGSDSGVDSLILDSPFELLIYNWDLMDDALKKGSTDNDEQLIFADLKALMNIISTDSGDAKLESYFKTREANRKNNKITFETLWTIFPPGELVYTQLFLKQDQVLLVRDNVRAWPHSEASRRRTPPWSVVCWCYDWDGRSFDRRPYEINIEPFKGTRNIVQLNVYPIKYYTDSTGNTWESELKPRLIDRGKRFREICVAKRGGKMFDYNGSSLPRGKGITAQELEEEPSDDSTVHGTDAKKATKQSAIKGTVMVDVEAYFQHTSDNSLPIGQLETSYRDYECRCMGCMNNEILRDYLKFDYDNVGPDTMFWQETQFVICPPRVVGFSIRDRLWAQLHIMKLNATETEKNPELDAFDTKLSLDDRTKKLIKNLILNHEKGKQKEGQAKTGLTDLVDEKGQGLVLLFHGVGKTLTAETVAISCGKPLLTVGVSDIGLSSDKAEKNLKKFLKLASEWEAVMLIDEADVFLNSRGQGETNLEKNALVSVLLRVLEYFTGILILTTNRINSFDTAVQSRVHVAVRYDNFSTQQVTDIYTTFLRQIELGNGLGEPWIEFERFIKRENKTAFNGRQIRNVVSSALGLARADSTKLMVQHLEDIVEITKDFDRELFKKRQAYELNQLARAEN